MPKVKQRVKKTKKRRGFNRKKVEDVQNVNIDVDSVNIEENGVNGEESSVNNLNISVARDCIATTQCFCKKN
jgi:hypothetical protein